MDEARPRLGHSFEKIGRITADGAPVVGPAPRAVERDTRVLRVLPMERVGVEAAIGDRLERQREQEVHDRRVEKRRGHPVAVEDPVRREGRLASHPVGEEERGDRIGPRNVRAGFADNPRDGFLASETRHGARTDEPGERRFDVCRITAARGMSSAGEGA